MLPLKALCDTRERELEHSLTLLFADFYGLTNEAAHTAVIESRDAALNKYRDNPEETEKRG